MDRIEESFYCETIISVAAVDATNESTSCIGLAFGDLVDAGAAAITDRGQTWVPQNRNLVIEDWGLVVLDTLGATEVCPITLVTDNTPTGAGSIFSTITTNSSSNCDEGAALDLDAAGETCTISNVQALILRTGFYRIELTDGGACTVFQSGAVWVRGRFLP